MQRERNCVVLLFFLVFGVYLLCPVITSYDSIYSIPLAKSILYEGNFDLDEYLSIKGEYGTTTINGHYYYYFPYASSIIAVPFVFVFDTIMTHFKEGIQNILQDMLALLGINHDKISKLLDDEIFFNMLYEKIIASFISALCVIVFYYITRNYLDHIYSLFLTLTFAFTSSLWSVASRGLWSHGPSILFLELAVLGILYAKEKPDIIPYVGVPLSIAYIIRPTNAISLALFSIYILYSNRKYYNRILYYCVFTALPLILFVGLNLSIYNSLLPPYFLAERITNISPYFFEALAGNFISPARGLFIFSPILLLSIYGVYLKHKTHTFESFDLVLIAIVIFHWLAISNYPHWWAGHSYGPRFFLDVTPFIYYYLIPVVSHITTIRSPSSNLWITLFIILVAISFFIHFKGAATHGVWQWNEFPINVDKDPSRLWNLTDIQFLR